MRRHPAGVAALLLSATLLAGQPALADGLAMRVWRPVDLTALPLLVMQHEHLLERTAEAMGLGDVSVTWQTSDAASPVEALAAGKTDLVMADLVPFLVAADAGIGTAAEIRAVGAIAQRPYILVTRNKAIRTIRDFGPNDRIAVAALQVSGPAVMLEMAAAQEWGPEHYDKLDRIAVAAADAVAAKEMIAGKGDVDAHFSRTPYADVELADPAIHRVMDSFDIDGPHTIAVLATTMGFRAKHTELCKAVLSALQAADDFISKHPGEAAEIFAATPEGREIPLEDLSDMIGDPDAAYRAAPAGVMRIARFLNRIGRLRRRPAGWADLFLPESRDLAGN